MQGGDFTHRPLRTTTYNNMCMCMHMCMHMCMYEWEQATVHILNGVGGGGPTGG